MSKMKSIDEAVSDIRFKRAERSMEDSLNYLSSTIEFIKLHHLNDSVKHTEFFQKYLDWLDKINKLSITD